MSRGRSRKSMTFGELTSGKLLDFECGPWRWYRGVEEIHMNKGRVGEERGGKKIDRCPFTMSVQLDRSVICVLYAGTWMLV
jgi:hypothetical protein